jgi:hypothetical protein
VATDPLVREFQKDAAALSEALVVACKDPSTWTRVAVWNGMQPLPHRAVADALTRANTADQPSGDA